MIDPEIGGKVALVVGGLLVGASTTFFITKHVLTKKYEEHLASEVEAIEAYYAAKVETIENNIDKEVYNDLVNDLEYSPQSKEDAEADAELVNWNSPEMRKQTEIELAVESENWGKPDHIYDLTPHTEPVPMNTWAHKVEEATFTFANGEPAVDEPDPVIVEPEVIEDDIIDPPINAPGGPEVISFNSWFDEYNEHSDIEITYFEEDNVFVDDRDEMLVDVTSILGIEFRNFFGYNSEDPMMVYVRNHATKTDYAVTKEEMSYKHYILGEQHEEEAQQRSSPRKMRDDD